MSESDSSSSDSEVDQRDKEVKPESRIPVQLEGGSECRIVIPGDLVSEVDAAEDEGVKEEADLARYILGPGLRREGSKVFVVQSGVLKCRNAGGVLVYWVNSHSKRYVASKGENVIGIVTAKAGDLFRVDIGTSQPASLSYLAFEGATKRNRPNVNVGDIVYAKLMSASRDTEAELVCVDSYGKKSGMGVLGDGGFVFTVPLNLIRKLLNKSCALLPSLGKQMKFEIAVGMNGRIWIKSRTARETICLANAIAASEHMSEAEMKQMCSKIIDALSGY